MNLIPFWIRFWQCIRKFKDSHDVYNIVNAGKYATNFIPVILAFVQSLVSPGNNWGPLKIVWLITNVFVTVYKLVWDYYKDWGLFQSWKNDQHEPFLRPNLLYPPVMVRMFDNWLTIWQYYIAIIENLILRFFWVILLLIRSFTPIDPITNEWLLFGVTLFEIFRRFVWNIIRLENEQLNNMEGYRVVHDVPLPFVANKSEDVIQKKKWYKRIREVFPMHAISPPSPNNAKVDVNVPQEHSVETKLGLPFRMSMEAREATADVPLNSSSGSPPPVTTNTSEQIGLIDNDDPSDENEEATRVHISVQTDEHDAPDTGAT